MGTFKTYQITLILVCIALTTSVSATVEEQMQEKKDRDERDTALWQTTYLLRSHNIPSAINSYQERKSQTGVHDFDILEQIGLTLLDEGVHSQDHKTQLASIYGASLAGISPPFEVLEQGLVSKSPEAQLASLQLVASFQDDRFDDLLLKAMSSPFLPIRLEAGFYLSLRKHPAAAGHLEALFMRIPPIFRFVFPEFFALIGTKESMSILRTLMDDEEISCRTEAILNAGRYQRDDLLPIIRKKATQPQTALQEASLTALMLLQDTAAIPHFKKCSKSFSPFVRLAAAKGWTHLGGEEPKKIIIDLVQEGNIYALQTAGDFKIGLDNLHTLTQNSDIQLRINAATALLKARDQRALPSLLEFLISDTRDLGIIPVSSPGRSLHAWKVIPSVSQHDEFKLADPKAMTLSIREQMLRDILELGEKPFLDVAKIIFKKKEHSLIPLLCLLLENLRTNDALALLREMTGATNSPLIRTYAALSLFRLKDKETPNTMLTAWLQSHAGEDILQFRPILPFHSRPQSSPYELTPEESSRLLFGIYQTFADEHTNTGIDLILTAIKQDKSINKYALAGLLLRSLQ